MESKNYWKIKTYKDIVEGIKQILECNGLKTDCEAIEYIQRIIQRTDMEHSQEQKIKENFAKGLQKIVASFEKLGEK